MIGFVKIFRSMTEWEWYTDGNTFRVFMHLLLSAEWDGDRAGCVETSSRVLADELEISHKAVRVALKHLVSTGEIEIKTLSRGSLIKIARWDDLQGRGTVKGTVKGTVESSERAQCDESKNGLSMGKSDCQQRAKGTVESSERAQLRAQLRAHSLSFNKKNIKNVKNSLRTRGHAREEEEHSDFCLIPSITDVQDYILQKHYNVDADAFYTHYTDRGWRIRGEPIRDWMAVVDVWSRQQPKETGGRPSSFDIDDLADLVSVK